MKTNDKYYTPEEIHYMDGGMFTMDNDDLRIIIAKLLACVPGQVVDYLVKRCYIISEWHSAIASYIPKKIIGGMDIIHLSDELFNRDKAFIDEIILHECAHCWLRHKSALFEDLTNEETLKQEEEATKLARKWLQKQEKDGIEEHGVTQLFYINQVVSMLELDSVDWDNEKTVSKLHKLLELLQQTGKAGEA